MIKNQLGGSLSLINGKKGVRYRLYKQEEISKLLINFLELSNDLDEIIIGSMLGDLSAEKPGVKSNTRLQLLPEAKSKG